MPNRAFLPSLLATTLTIRASDAQTVNVCGRSYDDAEANCASNPSCAELQCPNNYWEEGGVLMACFAVPMEKCNFGPPKQVDVGPGDTGAPTTPGDMPESDVPEAGDAPEDVPDSDGNPNTVVDSDVPPVLELDPDNTNYCGVRRTLTYNGLPIVRNSNFVTEHTILLYPSILLLQQPIDGGWNMAVAYCSPMTACKSGSQDECPDGWTCYNGVVCDPLSAMTDPAAVVQVDPSSPATDTSGAEGVPLESTNEDAAPLATTSIDPASESSGEVVPPSDETETAQNTDTAADVPVIVDTSSKGYCGPVGAEGRTRAAIMCSTSIACDDASESCPDGMVCHTGVSCTGLVASPPANDAAKDSPDDAAATDDSAIANDPPPENNEQSPDATAPSNMYCGPNPAQNPHAWMTAFAGCSPQTECGIDKPCRDGQFCYGTCPVCVCVCLQRHCHRRIMSYTSLSLNVSPILSPRQHRLHPKR